MTIPKVIYQTWKTKKLPVTIQEVRKKIMDLNPGYQFVLYDDDDMEKFVKVNFGKEVFEAYSQLNVGAAKADFWRYCILYKNGGIYLDMDADILRPMDELIRKDDMALVTREKNSGVFNNWIMIFEKGHPILRETIRKCCENIKGKSSLNICELTGPAGPFTSAVNSVMGEFYCKVCNLYFELDHSLNRRLNKKENKVRCRFYEKDMGNFAKWKNKGAADLYLEVAHWNEEKRIFKST